MHIGATIKEVRKIVGLTQQEVCDRADISPSYFSRIESCQRNPPLDTLTEISKALGIDFLDLFFMYETFPLLGKLTKNLQDYRDDIVKKLNDRQPASTAG